MPGTEPTRSPVATPLTSRELWPDLARGATLLLIALANVHTFLYDREFGVRGYPVVGDIADRSVTLIQMLLVDGRVYPLFGLLVGYGLARLARHAAAGGAEPTQVTWLLARRGAALMLIGALHGILLFSGDIIGAYGLLAVLLAAPIAFGSRFILGYLAACGLMLATVLAAGGGEHRTTQPTAAVPSREIADPLAALGVRASEWVLTGLIGQAAAVLAAVAFGAWVADQGWLQQAVRDRSLLRKTALLGITVAAVGGAPLALMAAGLWSSPYVAVTVAAAIAHQLCGFGAALGYAALAALVAAAAPGGWVTSALQACGQRSMTCYLTQSVVFVGVLAPFAGGLGATMSVAEAAVLAASVWVATVLASAFMARIGHRGPAEVVLRRLTYGRR